jgi:hypothetical protein
MSQTLLSNRYRIVEELVESGFSQTFLMNSGYWTGSEAIGKRRSRISRQGGL